MARSGEQEPAAQSPASKRGKRCIQSKLSWFLNPRVNGISPPSSPASPEAVAGMVRGAIKISEGNLGKCKRKRNSRKRSLEGAFEEAADTNKEGVQNFRKQAKRPTDSRCVEGMQSTSWPSFDRDYSVSLPPVHVFEALNDDALIPDWTNWRFLETNIGNFSSSFNLASFSALFEDSVEPLKMDSSFLKETNLDMLLLFSDGRTDLTIRTANSSKLSDGLVSKEYQPSSILDTVHVGSKVSLPTTYITGLNKWEKNGLQKIREASYHQDIDCLPDCFLWTEKYKPTNALEVCGNVESVEFLSEWLKSWHENGSVRNTNPYIFDNNNGNSYSNKHNMDGARRENSLKNALLIVGPVGCGKSAAVYACAREQGFKIIEINASSLRNGAYLRQHFGDAMDSFGLTHWLHKDEIHQTSKQMFELLSGLPDVADNQIHVNSNKVCSNTCSQVSATEKRSPSVQVANKTLLLFEEVDVVFDEDHGFISTIIKLAETTKRPIILTSNNRKAVHPQLLNRLLVLNFIAPSCQELLCYLSMVCALEKVCVSSNLLERMITASCCDIRRILMLLQFWCQGSGDDIDHRIQCSKTDVSFDIDAVHLAIPKLIPWDFPCQLSQKLEEEISKTISSADENSLFMGAAMQQRFCSKECIDPWETISSNTINLRRKKEKVKHGPTSAQCNGYNLPTSPTSLISQSHDFHGIPSIGQVENSTHSLEGASISHVCDTYGMPDISCVPQSSLIPEDESNLNSSFQSSSVSKQELPNFFCTNGYTANSDKGIVELSRFSENHFGSNATFCLESIQGNDDHSYFQTGVKKYRLCHSQLMDDECSRAGFDAWSAPMNRIACSQEVASVSETWRKLRKCRDKFKLYLPASSKDASLVTVMTSGLADLISETDFFYRSCNSILYESFGPASTSSVETDPISCRDRQIEMGSTFSQHGACLYITKCAKFRSTLGCNSIPDFIEMPNLCANSIIPRNLFTQKGGSSHISSFKALVPLGREPVAEFCNAVLRVVPTKLSMVLRSLAFHEYLSFMRHISRLEASCPVEHWNQKKRR